MLHAFVVELTRRHNAEGATGAADGVGDHERVLTVESV